MMDSPAFAVCKVTTWLTFPRDIFFFSVCRSTFHSFSLFLCRKVSYIRGSVHPGALYVINYCNCRGACNLCHSSIGSCGDTTTSAQCFISFCDSASIASLTWPIISFPRIKSWWYTVNCKPKVSSGQEVLVATSKFNSSLIPRVFRFVLTWCCWRISFLCVSSTVTETPEGKVIISISHLTKYNNIGSETGNLIQPEKKKCWITFIWMVKRKFKLPCSATQTVPQASAP